MGSYGMGGMYGGGYGLGGYGMGGMYGGGMYGMGMGMEQNPNLMNSMIALQSLGFLINSLCDIARSLDQNYEGIQLFRQSFRSKWSVLIRFIFQGGDKCEGRGCRGRSKDQICCFFDYRLHQEVRFVYGES